jgi:CRP-like cAMP-binding protein
LRVFEDSFNRNLYFMFNTLFEDQRSISYKKGETLCKQGTIASQIFYIEEGYAKVYIEHKEKNVILRILRSGDIIGYENLNHGEYYDFSAAALSDCKVKALSYRLLHDRISGNHKVKDEIIGYTNSCISGFFNRFISLTQKQLHGRLADAILHLVHDVYQSEEFDLDLTRKDMAEFTGMSTESAIRIMKEFHNDKIIYLEGKTLKIVSLKLLEKLSDLG